MPKAPQRDRRDPSLLEEQGRGWQRPRQGQGGFPADPGIHRGGSVKRRASGNCHQRGAEGPLLVRGLANASR